jgi:hypothetical protein
LRPALPQPRPKATTDKLVAETKTWLAKLKAQCEDENARPRRSRRSDAGRMAAPSRLSMRFLIG